LRLLGGAGALGSLASGHSHRGVSLVGGSLYDGHLVGRTAPHRKHVLSSGSVIAQLHLHLHSPVLVVQLLVVVDDRAATLLVRGGKGGERRVSHGEVRRSGVELEALQSTGSELWVGAGEHSQLALHYCAVCIVHGLAFWGACSDVVVIPTAQHIIHSIINCQRYQEQCATPNMT
jgi:hypothetical protein